MLSFNNVSTFYGKIQALHDVSIEVQKGEIVTLIGANGAGKSTLLMTLCGNPRATSCSIRYLGEELVGMDTPEIMRKSIAIVPEGRRVFARLTVEENLAMGGFFGHKDDNQEQLDKVLHLFPRLKERFDQRAGTMSGGWRVIRTLGKGLVEIESPQGMAAEATSAAIILTSATGGMALSTTHVSTGSIMGTGLGRRGAEVRWGVAMRMVSAWLITLPCAAFVGFATWWLAHGVSSFTNVATGAIVDFVLLLAMAALIVIRSRMNPVDASNVNNDWDPNSESVDSSMGAGSDRKEPVAAGAAPVSATNAGDASAPSTV